MLGKTIHLELRRRVTAYYLMFALAGVSWLTVGVMVVSRSLLSSRADSARLSLLGRTASQVAAETLRHGRDAVQDFVERQSSDQSLAYLGFVGPDGRYVAHSRRERVGKKASAPIGAVVEWGEVERIRFVDADSRILQEYRTPVRQAGKVLGAVHMAVPEPSAWNDVFAAAEYAPAAILGPLLFLWAGGLILQKMLRPVSEIEGQLRQLATESAADAVSLHAVEGQGSIAAGWNRLVGRWRTGDERAGLESRLSQALDGFRQRKADQILNSLTDGVALTDDKGRITSANQALAALLGAGADGGALCGKSIEDCLDLDGGGAAAGPLLNPELRARTVVVELARSLGAEQCVLRVARHPVRGSGASDGGGHVWSVRDVTQQKLAEQMRIQFVNSATHELRTPLANIKAYAETLSISEIPDVERQKEFCNIINSEATRLARFIDDLLSISSMEVGSLALVRQETDVERMLREAIEKVRPQMAQKRITLHHTLPEKVPKLKIDKDKIVAMLVNLLGNAAKYTPEGGQVTFRAQAKPEALVIDVEDNGIGISAAELPKVFDKLFRSSDPRVQQQTGSGLGLALAQEVVRLHGGKLSVQSELNMGTRFTVTLPLNQ